MAALAGIACEQGSEAPVLAVTRRDSAGITVVESAAPAWTEAGAWRVAAEPVVDLGEDTGDLDCLFELVMGVVLLPGNAVAVADRGAAEIRSYDSVGRILARAGGEGDGPGEFRDLQVMRKYRGDSLVAFDSRDHSLSILGPDLRLVRTVVPPSVGGSPGWFVSALADETVLWKSYEPDAARLGIPTGPYRLPEILFRYDPRSSDVEQVAALLGHEVLSVSVEGSPFPDMLPLPFGCESEAGAYADGYFTASSDTYELRFFAASGSLTRMVRRIGMDRSLRDGDVDAARAHITEQLEGHSDNPHAVAQLRAIASLRFPQQRPAFGRWANVRDWPVILVDTRNHAWVLRYLAPGETAERWDVFDTDGVFLGAVAMPDGFTLLDVGGNRVAGMWKDPDGVEHVRVYRLVGRERQPE